MAKKGIKIPLQSDGTGNFAVVEGTDLLFSRIRLLLSADSATDRTVGEVPFDTTFGNTLRRLRMMRNTTALAEAARREIERVLAKWVPEAAIDTIRPSIEGTRLSLLVTFRERLSDRVTAPIRLNL